MVCLLDEVEDEAWLEDFGHAVDLDFGLDGLDGVDEELGEDGGAGAGEAGEGEVVAGFGVHGSEGVDGGLEINIIYNKQISFNSCDISNIFR